MINLFIFMINILYKQNKTNNIYFVTSFNLYIIANIIRLILYEQIHYLTDIFFRLTKSVNKSNSHQRSQSLLLFSFYFCA